MNGSRRIRPRLSQRLADESGVALIVALAALIIIGVMVTAAATLAISTNQGSRYNVNQKNAAEAAEAGLQVALYRYNMVQPSSGDCVGSTGVGMAPSASGTCGSAVTTLGNGASYQYFTTPVMGGSSRCVGGTVLNSVDGVSNICLTAVGTSNGVAARTQIRAASFAGSPLFAYSGIVGLQGICQTNGSYFINAGEASNGPVTFGGSCPTASGGYTLESEPGFDVTLGPTGSYSASSSGTALMTPQITRLGSPIVLSPVNPGTSASTANNVSWLPTAAYKGNSTGESSTNVDPTTATGIVTNDDPPYYDPVVYNATTRSLTTSGGAQITLTGGVYNFCSFSSTSQLVINIATGAKVAIYIDSPNDPGSGCPSGSGSINLNSGDTEFINPSDDPTALQLYVYQQNTISFSQYFNFYGTIYAPTSTVELSGGISFTGGLEANDVVMASGISFAWDSRVATLSASTQGLYFRTAWTKCTASYSASAPGAGCG
jgi:Tfp pilus assembly protein PilX